MEGNLEVDIEHGERKAKGESMQAFLERKAQLSLAVEHNTIATDFLERWMEIVWLVMTPTIRDRYPSLAVLEAA